MPMSCIAEGTIAEGDAVVSWIFGGSPIVTRATAASLATSRTVFGIAAGGAADEAVTVLVAGEAIEADRTGLDTGAGAGTSRIIVTDITQALDADRVPTQAYRHMRASAAPTSRVHRGHDRRARQPRDSTAPLL